MGLDVEIFFKTKDGEYPKLERYVPLGFDIVQKESWCSPLEATHKVETFERYYGDGYERGDWTKICAVLMLLHASEEVEEVWYFADCCDGPRICRIEDVLELSKHFMEVGERPYRNFFK